VGADPCARLVGDDVNIGANAVVLSDIGKTAVGIPAKIISASQMGIRPDSKTLLYLLDTKLESNCWLLSDEM